MKLAAKSVDGVKDCKADYKKGTADVLYDSSKTTAEAIARVITEKTGFKATAPKAPQGARCCTAAVTWSSPIFNGPRVRVQRSSLVPHHSPSRREPPDGSTALDSVPWYGP
ncbi:MAG: heavy-metal-associated domain-containing protein [Acidobacteria bacterium]|nr:heavy-metal-associated domain-containing protein [Acidobacteriota bacterium]